MSLSRRILLLCSSVTLATLSGAFLSGCGQPVCVGPFKVTGPVNCYDQAATSGDASGNRLTVTVPNPQPVAESSTLTMTAAGGVAPYTFTLLSGLGTVTSAGVYTVPAGSGTVTFQVVDHALNRITVGASYQTVGSLTLTAPTPQPVLQGSTVSFVPNGGTGVYTYSVTSGGGSISPTGIYIVPSGSGTITVQVQDSVYNRATATITYQ